MTRLMSFWTRPTVAAKKAVMPPMTVTTVRAAGANSKIGDRRATMNTPAVTMVAAWMSAETGVGPSMASGSQVCSRNCADSREDLIKGDRVEQHEDEEDAEREAEIADAIDDESLHGRRVGALLLIPE